MKQFLAMLALAGFIAGCHTQDENMGSTGTDSTTISGSETNGSLINTNGTNGSSINTNGTSNGTSTQPSNGDSQSGSEPNSSR